MDDKVGQQQEAMTLNEKGLAQLEEGNWHSTAH